MPWEMSDNELRLLLQSVADEPAPPMPELRLPPRPALAPAISPWLLWCVGVGAALVLVAGALVSWWLLHGGLGVVVGELAALSAQNVPDVVEGLGFTDAILAGTLIALLLSPGVPSLAPRQR